MVLKDINLLFTQNTKKSEYRLGVMKLTFEDDVIRFLWFLAGNYFLKLLFFIIIKNKKSLTFSILIEVLDLSLLIYVAYIVINHTNYMFKESPGMSYVIVAFLLVALIQCLYSSISIIRKLKEKDCVT